MRYINEAEARLKLLSWLHFTTAAPLFLAYSRPMLSQCAGAKLTASATLKPLLKPAW